MKHAIDCDMDEDCTCSGIGRQIIAFDPGVQKVAAAHFSENGVLGWSGKVNRGMLGEFHQAKRIKKALVLVEMPRHYPKDPKTRRIDVNDLLDLAVVVGEIKDHFEKIGCGVELVFPRTWKGQVPKEIMSQRILEALTVGERENVPRRPRADRERRDAGAYDHNLLDACGLGLWKLGRLT